MRNDIVSSRERGFTLVEIVVAMTVALAVIAGALVLFQQGGKIARNETFVADMQDAIRVAQEEMIRFTRTAGRGGLPLGPLPQGIAVAVRNNVPASGDEHFVAVGDESSPAVLAGTDVLTVRGVISTPVYQANPVGADFVVDDPDDPTVGSIRLYDPHPTSGIPQDLTELVDALADDEHPALLLVGPLDDWVVVEVDVASSDLSLAPSEVRLAFLVGSTAGTSPKDRYVQMSGGFPAGLRAVSQVALLEEYRFYVRETYARPGDDSSALVPRLSQVRFYPNTETAHPGNSDLVEDIADNIFDLQVALGVDTDGDGAVGEGDDAAQKAADDWLFNTSGDVDGGGDPIEPAKWTPAGNALHYVRITTLARTDRPDLGYLAPELTELEDHDYTISPHDRFNATAERRYRRRLLRTQIDLRNL